MYLEKRNRPIACATDPIKYIGALGKTIRYNHGL